MKINFITIDWIILGALVLLLGIVAIMNQSPDTIITISFIIIQCFIVLHVIRSQSIQNQETQQYYSKQSLPWIKSIEVVQSAQQDRLISLSDDIEQLITSQFAHQRDLSMIQSKIIEQNKILIGFNEFLFTIYKASQQLTETGHSHTKAHEIHSIKLSEINNDLQALSKNQDLTINRLTNLKTTLSRTIESVSSNLDRQNIMTQNIENYQINQSDLIKKVVDINQNQTKHIESTQLNIEQTTKKIINIHRKVGSLVYTKPPIIIGGCGRSGTTLLLSMLAAHPEINTIHDETGALSPGAWVDNPDFKSAFNLLKLNDSILHNYQISHKRWMEKTPKNIHFFDRIIASFTDVKLIQIVRDGRDVILSKHPKEPDKYWVSPDRWIADVSAGLKYINHPNVITIRYEDLIQSHVDTMKTLCDFLDITYNIYLKKWNNYTTKRHDIAWTSTVKSVHDHSIGKWKNHSDQKRIKEFTTMPEAIKLLNAHNYI